MPAAGSEGVLSSHENLLGPVHLKDEMAFQDEIFRPEGENLIFVLRPKQFVPLK